MSKRGPKKKCSDDYIDLFWWLYDYGYSLKEIGDKFNYTNSAIREKLLSKNYQTRNRGRPSKYGNHIVDFFWWLYNCGYSCEEIGKRFSCSGFTIRRLLKAKGYSLRKKGRPKGKFLDYARFDEVRKLFDEGNRPAKIALILGCSRQNIDCLIKSHGYKYVIERRLVKDA